MIRLGSISVVALLIIMGVLALAASIGVRYWQDRSSAVSAIPYLSLNPECRLSSECLALDCGERSFVVGSDITFDTVEKVRAAWCGGAPALGRQSGVRCSSYHRCVSGAPETTVVSTSDLSSITDLEITSVNVYPNIASALIVWWTSAPTNSRVAILKDGMLLQTLTSASGFSSDHRAEVTGLESNAAYAYRIEASFQRGTAATNEGTFRVLPMPEKNSH